MSDQTTPTIKRIRAYFAPVNRATKTPTLFDPAQTGAFSLDTPPAPWIDLGWITNFTRTCGTKIDAILTAAPAVAQTQARTEIDVTVAFAFESWSKLQLSLACGTQQMNLLKTASGAPTAGSGGAALPATPILTGSTAMVLQVGTTAAATFSVGELLAVDIDNTGATGFVGSGVSGAYLKTALTDIDYLRRITLNVARIASIKDGALTLEAPLLAGIPSSAMKVSPVLGFCDREGSTFFQEWSALFVGEGQQGERVLWHYPRLQSKTGIAESPGAATGGYEALRLAASFRALPVNDPVDNETAVCFRSFLPAERPGAPPSSAPKTS